LAVGYFVIIICSISFVIWQDFVIVWKNTPCAVGPVTLLWLAYRIGGVQQCCQMV